MMDFLLQPSWNEKVPSPTGSDDSGLGLSPSPSTIDGRFYLESPGKSPFAIQNLRDSFAEETVLPYNCDASKFCISHFETPEVKCSNDTEILLSAHDQGFQTVNDIEKFLNNDIFNITEFTPSSQNKKRNSKNLKKRNSIEGNSLSAKLERCLQPKTGNGKPRQTSLKRKMKPTKKNKNYSGVRPLTVRERLEEIKRGKEINSSRGRPTPEPYRYPAPRYSIPYSDATCMSPYTGSSASPCSDSVFFSSTSLVSNMPFSSPSYMSPGNDESGIMFPASSVADRSMNPSLQSPPHCEQILTPCSSIMNLNSPPNVTLSPPSHSCIELSTSGTHSNYIPPVDTHQAPFLGPAQQSFDSGLCYPQEPTYFISDHCQPDAMPLMYSPSPLDIQQYSENDCCDKLAPMKFVGFLESACRGDIEKLEAYLKRMPKFLDKHDSTGMTPLLYATKNNQLEAVQLLLRYRASPRVTVGQGGCGIFHFAVKQSSYELLDLFMKTLDPSDIKFLINSRDTAAGGLTPLHIATELRNVEIVKLLLQNGANVTTQERKNGYAPLHIAVKNSDFATVKAILEFAKCSSQGIDRPNSLLMTVVDQKSHNDNTALHFAAELQSAFKIQDGSIGLNQNMIINILLECGANASVKNHQNQLPANLVPQSGSGVQVHDLLRQGSGRGLGPRCQSASVPNFNYPPLRQARGGATQ